MARVRGRRPRAGAAGSSKSRRLRAVGQLRMERTSVFLSISTSTSVIHSCSLNVFLLMWRILSKCFPFQIKLAKLHNLIAASSNRISRRVLLSRSHRLPRRTRIPQLHTLICLLQQRILMINRKEAITPHFRVLPITICLTVVLI